MNYVKKNGGPWWGVPKDLENKKFAVLGPLFDDRLMEDNVITKQKEGKYFNCETVEISKWSKKQVIDYWQNEGFEFVDSSDLFGEIE